MDGEVSDFSLRSPDKATFAKFALTFAHRGFDALLSTCGVC